MGLLDDAIRAHLELKRRSGADARELAKLEHDAFGPVRGGEDLAEEPLEGDEPLPVEDEAPAPLPEIQREPEPEPLPEEPFAAEPEPYEDLPEEDPQATVAFSLEDEVAAEEPLPEPPAPEEEPAPQGEYLPPAPPVPPRLREPAPEPDVVPADEEVGDHDELEETPDFLQETPEHDRLWFEQKPPRDFDF